jgi:NitT/TauT family transport system substrate-binding protein
MHASFPRRRAPGTLIVVVLSLALLLAVTIGHSADRGGSRAALRILVPQSTAALPFLLLEKEHALADTELTVTLFANHAQALALLARGEADLLYSGTSQGWENRLDGSSIVMVDTGVWGISSLVGIDPRRGADSGRDTSLGGFSGLRGRRLALPFPGAPLDFQTRALLASASIDPARDLTISYGPFAQSVQRLLAGQLDAVALPEPLATQVVKNNGLARLAEYAKARGELTGDRRSPQVSLFALEGFLRDHATLVAQLIPAWEAASRKVAADPVAAARAFAPALSVDPAVLEEATRHTLLSVPSPAENKARVLAYYTAVSPYLPGGPRPLDERFFFVP